MTTLIEAAARRLRRSVILGACWLAGALGGAPAFAAPPPSPSPTLSQTPPPSVEDFFKPPSALDPVLSPSGRHVALLVANPAGHRRLLVIDTADVHKISVAADFKDADIVGVRWVNDERLVFGLGLENESAFNQIGSGLFAVGRNGDDLRMLIQTLSNPDSTRSRIKSHVLSPDHEFLRTLRDGSSDVIVGHAVFTRDERAAQTPLRLDTRTGQTRDVVAGAMPDFVARWALDDQARPLAVLADEGGRTRLLVPTADRGWKVRNEFDRYGSGAGGFEFVGVGADGALYVSAAEATLDQTSALFKLDLQTGRPASTALLSLRGFDFDGTLVPDLKRHRLAGVHYVSDAPGTVWFDPALRALQQEIDARLPGVINVIAPAECGCSTKVLVTALSDHQPQAFFLYDRDTGTLASLDATRPWIVARQMADTDFARFKARDGLELPVYVTKPAGKGPFPAVVLVHGGPWVRGRAWGFSSEAQFLASRGYAVVEPEFRGSTGYGASLTRAGFRQWGLAMDDDLVDATRWSVARGWVDPKRVCVMGSSYGGYATLMALIRDPEVFRCGIAASAVTDLAAMYDMPWSDAGTDWTGYGMPQRIGDKVTDAAQFDATSPLKQAARLKQPLLLAHGGVDSHVPVQHAERLRSALLASGKDNLVWLRYDDEAHGWSRPETRYGFYRHVEKFLAGQIGPDATAR